MDYSEKQEKMIEKVIEKLIHGNSMLRESPSTRVMAINLLTTYNWDIDKTINSLE